MFTGFRRFRFHFRRVRCGFNGARLSGGLRRLLWRIMVATAKQHRSGDDANQHARSNHCRDFVPVPVQCRSRCLFLYRYQHRARFFRAQYIVDTRYRHLNQRREFIDGLRSVFHVQRQRPVDGLQQRDGIALWLQFHQRFAGVLD